MEHKIDPLFFDRWLQKNGIEHAGDRGLRLIKGEMPKVWNAMLHEYEGWYYAYHGRQLQIKRRSLANRVEPMWSDPKVVELEGGETPIEEALQSLRSLKARATNKWEPQDQPKPKPEPWKPPRKWHPPFIAPAKRSTYKYEPPFGPRPYVEYQGLQIPWEFKKAWCADRSFEPWEIESHYQKKSIIADLEADYVESLMVEVRKQQELEARLKAIDESEPDLNSMGGTTEPMPDIKTHYDRAEDEELTRLKASDSQRKKFWKYRLRGVSVETCLAMAGLKNHGRKFACNGGPTNVRLSEEWAKFQW